jgi:hypothetical protein
LSIGGNILRQARSFPPGSERNHHRQVALLFRALPTGLFQFMCLPPRSSIDVRPSTVLIKTPFCQIRIDIEELWISRHSEMPGTNDMPMTKDNRPRFETRTGIIRTTVKYDWILAQSREMPKHETWANDVVERARKWFDPEFPAGKQYIS